MIKYLIIFIQGCTILSDFEDYTFESDSGTLLESGTDAIVYDSTDENTDASKLFPCDDNYLCMNGKTCLQFQISRQTVCYAITGTEPNCYYSPCIVGECSRLIYTNTPDSFICIE